MKDRIKKVMESQHMSQQTFALSIGMSPASLSSIFNGRTKPTLNIVEAIKDKIPLKNVIQIIGTNGKGSTGRFLANAIAAAGFSVGHYTSPHVFKLNERIYLAGPTDKRLNSCELNLDHNSKQCLNLNCGSDELNFICDSKSPSKPNLNQSSSELAKQNFIQMSAQNFTGSNLPYFAASVA